jgi:hypothetical protein
MRGLIQSNIVEYFALLLLIRLETLGLVGVAFGRKFFNSNFTQYVNDIWNITCVHMMNGHISSKWMGLHEKF